MLMLLAPDSLRADGWHTFLALLRYVPERWRQPGGCLVHTTADRPRTTLPKNLRWGPLTVRLGECGCRTAADRPRLGA